MTRALLAAALILTNPFLITFAYALITTKETR